MKQKLQELYDYLMNSEETNPEWTDANTLHLRITDKVKRMIEGLE
jgi:hypothetical protein